MRSERICVDMRARVCRVCTRIAISGNYQDQDQDLSGSGQRSHPYLSRTYPHLALRVPTGPDLENSERLISGRSDLGAGNHLGTPLRQVAQGRAMRLAPACGLSCVRALTALRAFAGAQQAQPMLLSSNTLSCLLSQCRFCCLACIS